MPKNFIYEQLGPKINEKFGRAHLNIQYIDTNQDVISITSEEDLRFVLQQTVAKNKPIQLHITTTFHEQEAFMPEDASAPFTDVPEEAPPPYEDKLIIEEK